MTTLRDAESRGMDIDWVVPALVQGRTLTSADDIAAVLHGRVTKWLNAGGIPAEEWRDEVGDLLLALGWRIDRDSFSRPPAQSPSLDVLDEVAGAARTGWRVTGTDLAVATTARAVIRQD
jgi:hypothetical protein